MRQINDKDTAEQSTPRVNNGTSTEKKSTLHNKMLFKDAVALPPQGSLCILSHQIAPDSTLDGSNINGQQGTSNGTLKYTLLTYPSQRTIPSQLQWLRHSMC